MVLIGLIFIIIQHAVFLIFMLCFWRKYFAYTELRKKEMWKVLIERFRRKLLNSIQ